ncbi:SNF2 family N-terminal domain-containing protein [Crassisporium funariophilum]|nr:SNF2 family N-terminal domain-containing protein [Crassisporium funariophilum]
MSDLSSDLDSHPSQFASPSVTRVVLKLPIQPPPQQEFFVAPPRLPPAQKRLYRPLLESVLSKNEGDNLVNEVIGEYREYDTLFYFARYDGGIAHKFSALPFTEKYKELVDVYKQNKAEGRLPPFDPSAQYIHPLSRVRVKIRISSDQRSSGPRSDDRESLSDSQEEEDETTGESSRDEDYDISKLRIQHRRSSRSDSKKKLPFSPKKSRSRRVLTNAESDSDAENTISEEEDPRRTRRSTRQKKTTTINLVSDEDEYEDDDDGSDNVVPRAKGKAKDKKSKKPARPKSAQPMYGHFRDVSYIKDDAFSDDEEHGALRNHRDICEKCHLKPAHTLLAGFKKRSRTKGKKRKRTDDEFEETDDEQKYIDMGGWVRCLKCPVSAHWKCLASNQRDEVLKAARQKDLKDWESRADNTDGSQPPRKRSQLDIRETTEFICGSCMRGGICMGCMEIALEPDSHLTPTEEATGLKAKLKDGDVEMEDGTRKPSPREVVMNAVAKELLFRCFTCKRLAHYSHLPKPSALDDEASIAEIAKHYQYNKSWLCADCSSFRYGVDKILAWRPYPANSVDVSSATQELPNYKAQLPREYLVKWSGRSYRRLQWVPHMWLVSTNPARLKNFLSGGAKVELLKEPAEQENDAMEIEIAETGALPETSSGSRGTSVKAQDTTVSSWASALPDAERRIPLPWKRIDRVLDVVLWKPISKKQVPRKNRKVKVTIGSDKEDSLQTDERNRLANLIFDKGEEPPQNVTETVEEWEIHSNLGEADINEVAWAFIKWDELGYDEATWDAPPRPGEMFYEAFKTAFDRYINSRSVLVPKHDKAYWKVFDNRVEDGYRKHLLRDASDLDIGQLPSLKLMPFQVDGFNWLCNNWWNHQHCILADEMGLGKTVQIAAFLGKIADEWQASPALVVVPNSTITNWVREIERWAPKLRVVPFYGEKNARDIIKQFELYHKVPQPGMTTSKFHVLVTTYEALINPKDFTCVFKNVPRWEVLVVDEGQRLKNDNSLLFKKLNELKSVHRIIMTGTPLNNNIRELFNLMNFLDPEEWKDLEALEKQHEVLDEELVKQLHNRLRPYFLRRIKSEVLELPPKNEVIVPVSMAPLQKEVYRSILSHNLEILSGLTRSTSVTSGPTKGRINNVLMQLRKCLQHPYLYAEDIEPRHLPEKELHEKLIDASGKLRFLKALLPKLKERGHRVLLFSQFVIALNVIEDFLAGEGYKFLRLDGNTKGSARQKAMDDYNKPGSEYFIFLLTTRAGGVGINLFTADTVIIFDPDFNPHQVCNLQAIARAYRYGQQKTCLVFKLMVKESAEERIMQIGKKKLVLDHLIVQKMDDDEDNGGENIQSILTYGAQALFDSEENSRDITYTDNDIDKLIEKTEKEATHEAPKSEGGGLSFAFAKIWAADKDTLEEVEEDDQTDSWGQALQKITTEREKQQIKEIALSGRGARRRAADVAKTRMKVDPKESQKTVKGKSVASEGSAYFVSDRESLEGGSGDSDNAADDGDFAMDVGSHKAKSKAPQVTNMIDNHPLSSVKENGQQHEIDCGLCGQRHASGQCRMVDRSENLAEYREMLILHADDEPWEERNAAIRAIDEILYKRGHIGLIAGQPLHPVVNTTAPPFKERETVSYNGNAATSSRPRQDVPGSLNAFAPSQPAESSRKKAKTAQSYTATCLLCHQSPHLIKDCPLVRAGSKSISAHIKVLESKQDPSLANTVNILRNLLAKYKVQELATPSTSAGPQ